MDTSAGSSGGTEGGSSVGVSAVIPRAAIDCMTSMSGSEAEEARRCFCDGPTSVPCDICKWDRFISMRSVELVMGQTMRGGELVMGADGEAASQALAKVVSTSKFSCGLRAKNDGAILQSASLASCSGVGLAPD